MKYQLLLKPSDQFTIAIITVGLFSALLVYHWIWKLNQPAIPDSAPLTAEFVVDVNQAEWTELAMLPGIGETLARAIVHYRDQHGPFLYLQDLAQIDGIGDGKIRSIEPFVPNLPSKDDRLVKQAGSTSRDNEIR